MSWSLDGIVNHQIDTNLRTIGSAQLGEVHLSVLNQMEIMNAAALSSCTMGKIVDHFWNEVPSPYLWVHSDLLQLQVQEV